MVIAEFASDSASLMTFPPSIAYRAASLPTISVVCRLPPKLVYTTSIRAVTSLVHSTAAFVNGKLSCCHFSGLTPFPQNASATQDAVFMSGFSSQVCIMDEQLSMWHRPRQQQ